MEDDLNLDVETQEKLENKNRFEKLSEKVILTAKERDDANAKVKTESDARLKVEKERDFFRDFSQLSSRYPHATAYQEKILEKVNSGYTPEDATLAILAKEGKLSSTPPPPPLPENIAGGSASTAVVDGAEKELNQMSKEEKRHALLDLEKQGEELFRRQ